MVLPAERNLSPGTRRPAGGRAKLPASSTIRRSAIFLLSSITSSPGQIRPANRSGISTPAPGGTGHLPFWRAGRTLAMKVTSGSQRSPAPLPRRRDRLAGVPI